MRIGVFSDVHGHLAQLHQTLLILRQLEVDQLLCVGDLVDKGSDSDAVITLMQEQSILCVQGNHDAKARFGWLNNQAPLRDESLAYLRKLPEALLFEWAGVSVYVTHSNPWLDTSVYIYPTRPKALFKLVADSVAAQVIVLGHTHQPMRVEIDGKVIVNPGSVYGNRDLDARTCGVLSLPDRRFDIYDIDSGNRLPDLWNITFS
jgi:putative phosphoesterase